MCIDRYNTEVLNFNCEEEIARVTTRTKEILRNDLHKRGLVVALSGGIDSSVCAALCVKALGPKKVFGLLLPEVDSSAKSSSRGQELAEHLGIEFIEKNISTTLEAIGCYDTRDNAIKRVFPDYDNTWKNKIAIAGGSQGQFNHFKLIVQSPTGDTLDKRLDLSEYLEIVAATNYKQRIRKSIEYFHADRLNYAVVGTPNRLEYDQGFFVKNGDGSADIKPIAHLYKTQVYTLARHMGLPQDICNATPTTDTYSLPQGQDEFYFALPYQEMDKALWALNNDASIADAEKLLGLDEENIRYIFNDIESKRKTTEYLHRKGVLIAPVSEINY